MLRFLIISIFLLTIANSFYSQADNKYILDSLTIYTNENLEILTSKLKSADLKIYNDKNKIPQEVKKQLDLLTNDNFSIANKNENYLCCCTSQRTLPKRQLQFLAVSKDFLAMTYFTGGDGVSTHILLISYHNSAINDLWTGLSFDDIKTKKQLLKVLLLAKKKEYNLHWFL